MSHCDTGSGLPRTQPQPTPAADLPAADLRLVVTDMDGTLLDGEGRLPATLPALLDDLRRLGIAFVPASGRQHANLLATFGPLLDGWPVIAENGTLVMAGDEELCSSTLPEHVTRAVVSTVRGLAAQGQDVGVLLALKHTAVTDRRDGHYLDQARPYYTNLEVVDDVLTAPLTDVIKVAVYDFHDAERSTAPAVAATCPGTQVALSGRHWVDVMAPDASKGLALATIQERLGVTPAQTAVFGDYLNDLPLYEHAALTFAMANAHPTLLDAARYTAPAHTDDGVVRTVRALLDRATAH